MHGSVQHVILFRGRAATLQPQGWYYSPCCACRAVFPSFAFIKYRPAVYIIDRRWRPYRVECTGSLPTSEVKRRRARLVLGWETAREDLRVLPALFPLLRAAADRCVCARDLRTASCAALTPCKLYRPPPHHRQPPAPLSAAAPRKKTRQTRACPFKRRRAARRTTTAHDG